MAPTKLITAVLLALWTFSVAFHQAVAYTDWEEELDSLYDDAYADDYDEAFAPRRSLVEEAPTAAQLIRNKGVMSALCRAWKDSCVGQNLYQERGGWIYMDVDTGKFQIRYAPKSRSTPVRDTKGANPTASASVNLGSPWKAGKAFDNTVLVADFHTHPRPLSSNRRPSQPDINAAYDWGVPGIVLSGDGIFGYGPTQRRSLTIDPARAKSAHYPNDPDNPQPEDPRAQLDEGERLATNACPALTKCSRPTKKARKTAPKKHH